MRSWLAIVAFGLATGCVVRDDEEPEGSTGTVELSWQMGPSGCVAAGITEVEVDIGGVGGTFDCEEGGATIGVPAGTHDVVLTGVDATGDERFGGEELGVVVTAGETTVVPTIVLGALPASLTVNWSFANGQLCTPNGVEEVEAFLFDEADVIQGQLAGACDEGTFTLEDIDADSYTLRLVGKDEGGTEIVSGTADVLLERGENSEVSVVLADQP